MKKAFNLFELLTLIAVIAIFANLTTPAFCQVDAFSTKNLTLSNTTVPGNTTAHTVTTPAIQVRGSDGIGFVVDAVLNGAGTNALNFKFNVSTDGSTWTTTAPFQSGNITCNGNTTVRAFWNFGPTDSTELRNIRWIRLSAVDNLGGNATANATLSNMTATFFNP